MTPRTLNPATGAGTHDPRTPNPDPLITNHQSPITLSALCIAATVLIIPLMQGGLIPQTLPALSLLVGLAFLAETRRLASQEVATSQSSTPWFYVWLIATLLILGQPLAREALNLKLTAGDNTFTRIYWLTHLKYWSFFTAYWLLAWTVSRQQGRARALIVIAVIAIALFEALYGTIAFVNGQETILGIWPKTNVLDSVTGTFHNRNHLAALLALAMTLGAGYLMSQRWTRHSRRSPSARLIVTVLFLVVAGAALIGTASRLGIVSALAGLFVWAWLHARSENKSVGWQRAWIAALVLLPVLAGLWFGPQHLIERLFQLDEALGLDRTFGSTGRPAIWLAMLGVPGEVWLQGVGAGAFHDVFKLIQPVTRPNSVWRAHSDHLQFAFEFGLVGLAILIPVVVYWIRKCRPTNLDSLQRGALTGIIAVLIHNTAEFNMQIPGTAVIFWTSVGILFSTEHGKNESQITNHESPTHVRHHRRHK